MSLPSPGNVHEDLGALRRTMRDMVALTSLPSVWAGYDVARIAQSFAEAARRVLDLTVAFVRVPAEAGSPPRDCVVWAPNVPSPPALEAVVTLLGDCLQQAGEGGMRIPHPVSAGEMRVAVVRFAADVNAGGIVAGAARPDFPTEHERLLLSVATNQAGIAIRRRQIEEERLQLLEGETAARKEAEALNEITHTLLAELDLHKLAQQAADVGTQITGAQFGAFFYNAIDEQGSSGMLYKLSGAPPEAFADVGLPRNTPLFAPTFRGEGVVRVDDVTTDPRYGKNPPHSGIPPGHLPVRSYLAVPVISRFGLVLGGLLFGHDQAGVFDDRAERLAVGLAAQAAIAMDNAQLCSQAQKDIAERRLAEGREREARTAAERAARMRDDFLATVSHELRTPLNAILGWAQLLRRNPHDADTRVQAIESIERGARAQARLIEDLLDVSRIISGKLRLDVQTIELFPLIESAIATVRPAADAKNIRIERVLDPLAGPVKGDASRLQQVMWNLLSNAVKFTPKGGRIQVHLERVSSHVEIVVSDTGQGIAPEFLPTAFDRFSQAEAPSRRYHGGLGLGLAVVRHLVELHGGKVHARSPGLGQGSTFSVHLPIALVRETGANREHPSAPREGDDYCGDVKLKGVRILVVDDDLDACNMLRRVLTDCEAEVFVAQSGQEALERFAEIAPHVMISDIGMPVMDGYELMRRIRAGGHQVPAVAVTAFARSDDRIRALQAGYNMHIAKPLEPRELLTVIASLALRTPLA